MADLKTILFTDIVGSVDLKSEMPGRSDTERDQAFIDQVLSKQGQATMLKYGFLPISVPVPTIVGLSASKGKPGMKLTVTGTNFTGTTSVRTPGCRAANSARTRSTWASAIGESRETMRISSGTDMRTR